MTQRTSALARFSHLLEVDPDSLESLLPRAINPAESDADADATALAPAQWERLIQILKHQLDRLSDPQLRLLAIQLVGEVYEHRLADGERAFRWWAQVLGGYPFVDAACDELERLARAHGLSPSPSGGAESWERVVQVYGTVRGKLEPGASRRVQLREARVQLEQLGQPEKAERLYLALWQRDRQSSEILSALEAFYIHTGRQAELVKVLRQRIDLADTVEERTELRLRLGYLYEVEQGEGDLAAGCYRKVLHEHRSNRPALEALEQIYLRQERWLDLLAILERMAAIAADDGQRAGYLVRMVRICDDTLGDRVRSRELWQRVLQTGDDPELLSEMARRFESMERWEELAQVLERQARMERDPATRQRLFEQRGRILGDRLEDRGRALQSWQQVLQSEPENVQALLALSDLYGGLQAWPELRETLQRLIEITARRAGEPRSRAERSAQCETARRAGEPRSRAERSAQCETARQGREPELLVELYRQVARVESEYLQRTDAAIQAWQRVLELSPEDDQALQALESLLSAEARWEQCVEILERRLQQTDDSEQQVELLLRQATVWRDGLGHPQRAMETYRRALKLQPGCEVAHQELCAIHRVQGEFDELLTQIFSWLETVDNPQQAVKLLQEAAVVYEEQLDRGDQAFTVWQSALRQDPQNEITTSNLERLAGSSSRWEELLAVYDEVVQKTQSAPVKVGLLVSMGRCVGLELGQLDRAVSLLHDALRMDPESIPALEVLQECYRRSARWVDLVPLLKRHAELERDGERVVQILCSMAELQSRLGDPGQAIATFRKVQQIDPGHLVALCALEALYLACGMWEPLVEVLRRQVELEPEREAAIQCQIGEVLQQQLQQPEPALQAYRRALALEPDNAEAMGALQTLYDQTDQSEAYLDVVERQLDCSGDSDEERAAMYRRIAAGWQEQLQQPARAMACLEKLLALAPADSEAHLELERLCRMTGDHQRLVQVLRRHADVVTRPAEKARRLLALAEVYEVTRLEPEQAIAVHEELLALDGRQPQALAALARLYEKLARFSGAVTALSRLVPLLTEDPAALSDVLLRLGRINHVHLEQLDQAEAYFEQALRVDPTSLESMLRLSEIFTVREQWEQAAEIMVRAEPCTDKPAEKARLLYEAGMICLERLNQEQRAVELLARTLEIDPDHVRAGVPLARIYFRKRSWARLEPVLDMLARKVDQRGEGISRHDVLTMLGRTATELDRVDKAIRCYQEARGIDLLHLPTLQALGALQLQTEAWHEAFKTYQTILVHHREELGPEEVVSVFHRLGHIKASQGERRKALNFFDKALEENPSHRPSLQAVIELQTALQSWDGVARAKTRLMAQATPQEQFELLRDCGELYRDHLDNTVAAVEAFQAAAALRPDDRVFLNQLLDLLIGTQRWTEALEVVLRLTRLEQRAEIRAKFFYTAAVICREQLDRPDQALELFNAALDCDMNQLKAFEAVDRMCTAARDWSALERHYRRMILRVSESTGTPGAQDPQRENVELLGMLWHNLGEVYRTRLRQLPEAIAAFESAAHLQPDNLERHVILAELYERGGVVHAPCAEQGSHSRARSGAHPWARAIVEHQTLVAHDPLRMESFVALHRLFTLAGQLDEAWCLARTLCFLGRADEQASRLYQQHLRPAPRRPRTGLGDALWSECVLQPGPQRHIDRLVAALAPMLMELQARPAKNFGLKRRERIKANTGDPLVEMFHHVTQVVGGIPADLYSKSDQSAPLMVANTTDSPSLVVGPSLTIVAAGKPKELAFLLGQQLTYFRPEYIVCRLFPSPTQLRLVLLASMSLAGVPLPPSAESREVEQLAQQLAGPVQSHPDLVLRLRELSQPLVHDPAVLDLNLWWTQVALVANRVGFILCDDLELAAATIRNEPALFGTMPASDKVRELVSYSVSPAYFRVRRELGLGVG